MRQQAVAQSHIHHHAAFKAIGAHVKIYCVLPVCVDAQISTKPQPTIIFPPVIKVTSTAKYSALAGDFFGISHTSPSTALSFPECIVCIAFPVSTLPMTRHRIQRSPPRPASRMLGHELENQICNLVGLFVECEMARVQQVDFGVG
jgi:hypothetical protein